MVQHAAPACHKGDFTAIAVQPVIHRALLRESELLLACQKWGQENGGVKGKMVIRKRNSISPEMVLCIMSWSLTVKGSDMQV